VQRGERDLRGPHQEELVPGDLIDHLSLIGEEPGAVEGLLADENRGHRRLEALAADQLHRESHQRELEHHQVAEQVGEARARGVRRRLHLDPAVRLAQLEMVDRLEAERGPVSDLPKRDVVLLGHSVGRRGVRKVGQEGEQLVALGVELCELRLELLELGLEPAR
jgi:hypothetical protein